MKKIILASNNEGKLKEFNHLFSDLDIIIEPIRNYTNIEANETGLSFIENAIIKARHAAHFSGLPSIADDSGLVVPFLKGAPGIYSARYSPLKTDDANNALLLKKLEKVPQEQRSAFFICILAFVRDEYDPIPIIAEGRVYGEILKTPRGESGFGYDPLFFIKGLGKSMAELSIDEKNYISHRSIALKELKKQLPNTLY